MEQLLSIRRAAKTLQVSEKFLRKLQHAGALRVIRLGRAVRVPKGEIERLYRQGGQR